VKSFKLVCLFYDAYTVAYTTEHSSSDRRAERTCAHGALNCTVLLEFNTFQSQLILLFYTACLFSYFSCPWAVCL